MPAIKTGSWILLAAVLSFSLAGSTAASKGESTNPAQNDHVQGDYVEARTCDVWTGPCFANGEINLKGDHAVLGWSVGKGLWKGVRLDGLKAAAAIDSVGTLGTNTEGRIRAVLFVDLEANEAQRAALIELVKTLAGRYLEDIVRIESQPIDYRASGQQAEFSVAGGKLLKFASCALSDHCDRHCGNEEKAYPTLASTSVSDCAKTLSNAFSGEGLQVNWSAPNARSAMLGKFELGRVDS